MAKYREPPSESEVLRANVKAVFDWIEKNERRLRSDAKTTIFYSGVLLDTERRALAKDKNAEDLFSTPVWMRLMQMDARLRKRAGKMDVMVPGRFDTLETILQRISDYPDIISQEVYPKALQFSNAHACFDFLKGKNFLFPKHELDRAWEAMSEALAENSSGDVKFVVGLSKDYDLVGPDKAFIKRELKALIANPKLSPESKKRLQKTLDDLYKYLDHTARPLLDKLQADIKNAKL